MKKNLTLLMILLLVLPLGLVRTSDSTCVQIIRNNNKDFALHDQLSILPRFKTTHMVPMRDGVKLATDVYRPLLRSISPHGTILIRTPYDKDNAAFVGIIGILKGWPIVIQDMRGYGSSEGVNTGFKNDSADGADTLAWIANQSWSNGKIATYGLSALGIVQYCAAGAAPPNLTCQYIQVATPNLYKHAAFQGGEFRKNLVEDWLEDQESEYLITEIKNHENFTLGYWRNVTLDDNWEDVNVPAIHIGGWYDIFSQGTIEGYLGYQHKAGPGAQGKSKLIMGPWTHTGFFSRKQGQLTYPRNSLDRFSLRMFQDMVQFYVLNKNDEFSDWPTVSYYVMGDVTDRTASGNEWRFADDWPVPADEVAWYFHEDGSLRTQPPGSEDPLTYVYDPNNPVPTIGGNNLYSPAGPYDQQSVENRSDVLIFTSPVFQEPYEATGPIKARLFVSSDCPDTDFTVKLTDVYPDGRAMLITDGILRMRNRNGQDHWEFMEPDMVYDVEVDLWSTSYVWNTGHQIRVEVSSSNYPRFLNNPNTKDGIGKNTTYAIAHNTLYTNETHPSCILLPEPHPETGSSSSSSVQGIRNITPFFLNTFQHDFYIGIRRVDN